MNRSQKKTLFLLVGIIVVLAVILAVVTAVRRSNEERAAEEEAAQDAASVITETEASYSALSYDNGSATLSFHLDESGKWVWSDDPEFPLDDSTIQSILSLLTNLKPQQTITEGDTLEAYGLDQPAATLTATKPDGGTLTGIFRDGSANGPCEERDADGNTVRTGVWKDGAFVSGVRYEDGKPCEIVTRDLSGTAGA